MGFKPTSICERQNVLPVELIVCCSLHSIVYFHPYEIRTRALSIMEEALGGTFYTTLRLLVAPLIPGLSPRGGNDGNLGLSGT